MVKTGHTTIMENETIKHIIIKINVKIEKINAATGTCENANIHR
jgi:hypothetical protein